MHIYWAATELSFQLLHIIVQYTVRSFHDAVQLSFWNYLSNYNKPERGDKIVGACYNDTSNYRAMTVPRMGVFIGQIIYSPLSEIQRGITSYWLLQITLQGELNAVAHKELIVKLRQVTRLCEDMYVFLFPLFLIKFPVGFKPLLFHKKK